MRASIIIAAHNEGALLSKTIAAAADALEGGLDGGLDHELVLANDASTDGSVEAAMHAFPWLRLTSHDTRQGAAATKALGAAAARGDVLCFLDGHTYPQDQALARLVEAVEALEGEAILTPAIASLDVQHWTNRRDQVGYGYAFALETLDTHWVALEALRPVRRGRLQLYESPALIGCAFALSRGLYEQLRGFDRQMRSWGVEDLDLGLKAWLLGHPILHEPQAVVGHRFRASFDSYAVPLEDVLVNQLRLARKHLTGSVWSEWVERCRQRAQGTRAPGAPGPGELGQVAEHPEGVFAHGWHLFEQDRASVEQERAYLLSHRVYDEFWYAQRFALPWPRLQAATSTSGRVSTSAPRALTSSPPPTGFYGVDTSTILSATVASQLSTATFPGDPTKPVSFVGRYLAYGAKSTNLAEVTNIHNASLTIFSILQQYNNAPKYFDNATGTAHARRAIQQANALGQPHGTPIYFAVDYDPYVPPPAGGSVNNVMAYFQAVNAEFANEGNPYAVGVYGCGQLLTDLQNANLATYFWQAAATAWTGNRNPWPGRNMRQVRIDVSMLGVQVDLDEAPSASSGAW